MLNSAHAFIPGDNNNSYWELTLYQVLRYSRYTKDLINAFNNTCQFCTSILNVLLPHINIFLKFLSGSNSHIRERWQHMKCMWIHTCTFYISTYFCIFICWKPDHTNISNSILTSQRFSFLSFYVYFPPPVMKSVTPIALSIFLIELMPLHTANLLLPPLSASWRGSVSCCQCPTLHIGLCRIPPSLHHGTTFSPDSGPGTPSQHREQTLLPLCQALPPALSMWYSPPAHPNVARTALLPMQGWPQESSL